jgi:hypothetical protein
VKTEEVKHPKQFQSTTRRRNRNRKFVKHNLHKKTCCTQIYFSNGFHVSKTTQKQEINNFKAPDQVMTRK